MSQDHDRTASLMSPAKLAQLKPKAAASPAAWLDQMASDAGHMHVRQLAELTRQLQAVAEGGGDAGAGLPAASQALRDALPQLDTSLLQPRGWLARATGKARSAGAEFASQFERIDELARRFQDAATAMQKKLQGTATGSDRTLLEFEVEWRAIEKIIDQGARWLQDMRSQLKTRQAAAVDEPALQQLREDAARCELLVARLKLLRATASAAQQVQEQVQAVTARRSGLLQALQSCTSTDLKNWRSRWAPVAAEANERGSTNLSLEGPEEARRELGQRLARIAADEAQLREQEKALTASIADLSQHLQAAA